MPPPLDRLAPARRDACTSRRTGRQMWNRLLFLHHELPVAQLRALVPEPLAIDTFDGRAYVGVVPFTMQDVRVGPLPLGTFLECNVRTYVHAEGVPGVYFFSLDATRALAVLGGRAVYRLPYFRAAIACDAGATTEFRLVRDRAELDVQWTITDDRARAATPDTLEHFLVERYALYGPRRDGGVYRLRVHHAPWPLRTARIDRLRSSLLAAAGISAGNPIELVLASPDGVDVETFATERPGEGLPGR